MAIDLVTQYQGLVDEKFSAESKRSLVTNKDYKWTGAHSIKIYKVSTAEMNDYGRNGGSNRYGTPEDLDATTEEMVLTPMKNCFKSVYGSPIFTYMRNYRMNYAAALLKSDKSLKVAEIAGLVGYDSPSKFTAAFHQTMGKTPLEYRKSII